MAAPGMSPHERLSRAPLHTTTPCFFSLGVPDNHLIFNLSVPGSVQGQAARAWSSTVSWKESFAHVRGWDWMSFMVPSHTNHSGTDSVNITWSPSKDSRPFHFLDLCSNHPRHRPGPRAGPDPSIPAEGPHAPSALQGLPPPRPTRPPEMPPAVQAGPGSRTAPLRVRGAERSGAEQEQGQGPTPLRPPAIPTPNLLLTCHSLQPERGPALSAPPRPCPRAHWLRGVTPTDRHHRWPIEWQAAPPAAEGGPVSLMEEAPLLRHRPPPPVAPRSPFTTPFSLHDPFLSQCLFPSHRPLPSWPCSPLTPTVVLCLSEGKARVAVVPFYFLADLWL